MTLQPIKIIFSTLKKGKIDTYKTQALVGSNEGTTVILLQETSHSLIRKRHDIAAAIQVEIEQTIYECSSIFLKGVAKRFFAILIVLASLATSLRNLITSGIRTCGFSLRIDSASIYSGL